MDRIKGWEAKILRSPFRTKRKEKETTQCGRTRTASEGQNYVETTNGAAPFEQN